MKYLNKLLIQNRQWVKNINKEYPNFFRELSNQQKPNYLWIGCSDSRVPANEILGLLPGHVFVHRNVANIIVHSDLNALSVLQYAVDVLKVKHILVCGHYGCGGIKAATLNESYGLIDNWLKPIHYIGYKHRSLLNTVKKNISNDNLFCRNINYDQQRCDITCELNVVEQVINVSQTTIVQNAWKRNQKIVIHGCIYALTNGLLKQIAFGIDKDDEIEYFYDSALMHIRNNLYNQKT